MPEYGPCAIPYASGSQLGAVYLKVDADNTGAISLKSYWDHATEAWEAGPLDPAKHVLPLQRLATAGADAKGWILFLAVKPFQAVNTVAQVYQLDATGLPAETVDFMSRKQARYLAGID